MVSRADRRAARRSTPSGITCLDLKGSATAMKFSLAVAALACALLSILEFPQHLCAQAPQSMPPSDFHQLLQEMAQLSPNPCGPSHGKQEDWRSEDLELRLFSQAADVVVHSLNAGPGPSSSPEQ